MPRRRALCAAACALLAGCGSAESQFRACEYDADKATIAIQDRGDRGLASKRLARDCMEVAGFVYHGSGGWAPLWATRPDAEHRYWFRPWQLLLTTSKPSP